MAAVISAFGRGFEGAGLLLAAINIDVDEVDVTFAEDTASVVRTEKSSIVLRLTMDLLVVILLCDSCFCSSYRTKV